jgi:hypothetical protein
LALDTPDACLWGKGPGPGQSNRGDRHPARWADLDLVVRSPDFLAGFRRESGVACFRAWRACRPPVFVFGDRPVGAACARFDRRPVTLATGPALRAGVVADVRLRLALELAGAARKASSGNRVS